MSTDLEYKAKERQRKKESRRQASEAQPEKGQQRSRAINFVAATNQMQGENGRQ